MSDAVSVHLTILSSQDDEAKKLFTYESDSVDVMKCSSSGIDLTTYTFCECNYGELGFTLLLTKAGISYDKTWEQGSEFNSGTEYSRFTPEGEIVWKEIYENEINPDLNKLMELIDDPSALTKAVRAHHELITVLSWSNQEEYGKIYRTLQLLNPES